MGEVYRARDLPRRAPVLPTSAVALRVRLWARVLLLGTLSAATLGSGIFFQEGSKVSTQVGSWKWSAVTLPFFLAGAALAVWCTERGKRYQKPFAKGGFAAAWTMLFGLILMSVLGGMAEYFVALEDRAGPMLSFFVLTCLISCPAFLNILLCGAGYWAIDALLGRVWGRPGRA